MSCPRWRAGAATRAALFALTLALLAALGAAGAQSWEMRVCADPNVPPFSTRDETGFENRIASILADELGAELTYDWFTFGPNMIDYRLRAGECDMIMGVPDGHAALLNTVAYYRSPYVFVYRSDSGLELSSLDDPLLRELDIGLQSAGIPPHDALVKRNLGSRITLRFGAYDPLSSIIEAVANGEVDVALAWGPVAGYYAARQDVPLEVVPVRPEIDPPFLSMVIPMTIGVRAGDEALRDRLDVALANRWEEIQQVLEEYGVPLSPLPQPVIRVGGQ